MTITEISQAYPDLLLIDGHESALVGLAVVGCVKRRRLNDFKVLITFF